MRAVHLSDGRELQGSPLTLPAATVSTEATAPLSEWPAGLAGDVGAASVVALANGLFAAAGAPARSLRFEMIDQPAPAGPPIRGVRLTAGVTSQHVTAHFALVPLPPGGMAHDMATLAWLPQATEPAQQVQAELWLTRRTEAGFVQLRRLRRTRMFRRPAWLSAELLLGEAELAEPGELFISVVARDAAGLCAMPPKIAPSPPTDARMEDARLETSFRALEELVRLHGDALAAHPLLPVSPQPTLPAAATGQGHPFTEVVLPIYNGDVVVRDCLRSLREAATNDMRVLVVDDGSRAFTAEMVAGEIAGDPRFMLLRRDINRGYTKSINEGVMLTTAPWVVILNSDTLVPPGWLARLHAAVQARPGTGMAGPLSNAASWQSIPDAKRADGSWSTNDAIDPADLPRVQALLDAESERAYPEFPVLNGFCTLIARAVFDRVGLYDEDAFPMGYGEETDLCLRARRAGFRLTVADDCFVYHHKSVSFGSANRARLTRAGRLEMTNKHLGANIAVLERRMQAEPALQRLRARMRALVEDTD
ncbi:glycosyltransferase family 2 protein [Falsiroseomonas sp.]|uniref:glycosyltransferase family 2 protein n=1 Tax=Falsiroseomonas sp. TaxID=2870721 RepID=UPI0034A2FA9D